MDALRDYFMRPTPIEYIGEVHAVKLKNISRFNSILSKYLIPGRKFLRNMLKYPDSEYVLDFFVKNACIIANLENSVISDDYTEEQFQQFQMIESNTQNKYIIGEMEELFSLTLQKEVKFIYYGISDDEVIDYVFEIDEKNFITKYNFEKYREVVMRQNMVYEPLTSPSEYGNQAIQKAIEARNSKGSTSDIQSICSVVSVYKGISDEELYGYTYFRLMMDFETINRINGNIFSAIFMSIGSKDSTINSLAEVIDLDNNPYKDLLKKTNKNDLDKRLGNG